ncbi:MgsA AAA+ ATPase C terminal [Micromonospora rhizosphaerae]|uniref:MgsA AAA+ ATPase C terminal n=1 Tax=Micromonospora rhizosphaerae TaxID=568872 RepID=A0A1C6RBQ6_9ACTN|nr:MgsA AAA+ ATPase C terminal [Micromonospora rhizosphaerae]
MTTGDESGSARQFDPWTKVRTLHDLAADEVISAFQKAVRRGELEEATLLAYEMYATSEELEECLWHRLQVISVEDVGSGSFLEPVIVDAVYRMHGRVPRGRGDRFLFAVHAIRLLVGSTKDRTSDELANWAAGVVQNGQRLPQIPDHALDMHTRRGQEMGRDLLHFLETGAFVNNEVPHRDTTYREWLLAAAKAERK